MFSRQGADCIKTSRDALQLLVCMSSVTNYIPDRRFLKHKQTLRGAEKATKSMVASLRYINTKLILTDGNWIFIQPLGLILRLFFQVKHRAQKSQQAPADLRRQNRHFYQQQWLRLSSILVQHMNWWFAQPFRGWIYPQVICCRLLKLCKWPWPILSYGLSK